MESGRGPGSSGHSVQGPPHLLDVVQALLTAFQAHDHCVGDHACGKLHHCVVVGGREQDHLTRLGQLPGRGRGKGRGKTQSAS